MPDRRVVPAPSSEQPDIDRLAAELHACLTQWERAMAELGWTMRNVNSHAILDELVALARDGWQTLEHPFDQSEYDAVLQRAEAAEARVAELKQSIKTIVKEDGVVVSRQARRVAELEADLRSIRLWWKRKPWEGSPDPGSWGGHPYSPRERAMGYGTISDPRFLPPALAGDGGGA